MLYRCAQGRRIHFCIGSGAKRQTSRTPVMLIVQLHKQEASAGLFYRRAVGMAELPVQQEQ